MVNWNSRAVRVGMVIDANLRVIKVTEMKGKRYIHLRIANLPPGFEAKDFVVTVFANQQDITLSEANQEIPG